MNKSKIKLITFILLILISNSVLAEAYFDISDDNIKIETNFIGKEVIIFGILNDDQDTILTIKGPERNAVIQKKERILGFWFNTKQITYNQIPSIFFIASSNNIEDILPASTIIKEELSFNYLLENKTSQRNFISGVSLNTWIDNFVRIKKSKNLFKEYNVDNIDNKLFQTRIFFPAKSIPGEYKVNVYQIENNLILNNKEKIITLKKSGIGSQIYNFAHKNAAAYGLFAIIFAVLSGFLAATLFRRS
ncbi:MAG: TIGR02186 family protein [Alphaproteobacteria bacterium]|nr:TIGR02186 family protein [Alphaproteobacteria bacterium]